MKAIINGKLVFPERIIDGSILIEGGRIVAAGQVDVPADAEILDAAGLYVGPGLIDQHSHGYQWHDIGISVNDDPAGAARGHGAGLAPPGMGVVACSFVSYAKFLYIFS